MSESEAHETPDTTGADGAQAVQTGDGPALPAPLDITEDRTDAQKAADGDAVESPAEGVEIRKIASGVYSVYQSTGPDTIRRIGSVAKVAEGEWLAYSNTGHAGKLSYKTRGAAAEALSAARRAPAEAAALSRA